MSSNNDNNNNIYPQVPQQMGFQRFQDEEQVPHGQPVVNPYPQLPQYQQQPYHGIPGVPAVGNNFNLQMYPPLPNQGQCVINPNFNPYGVPPLPTSRISQSLFCPACNQIVPSKVQYDNGSGTYIAGGVIAACGFWLGCCLIPCAVDDCKDSVHFCSRCNTQLGKKRFLFD